MPERSSKVQEKYEEAGEYELPYVSKSRVMEWIKNPNHFRLKYLEEIKEPETAAMRRGTDIHETFESIYEWVSETGSAPGPTEIGDALPDDRSMWADYMTPYLSNFLSWELERENEGSYIPISIEEEHWRENPTGGPELMGLADVIIPADSAAFLDENEGVVIVDFKTGKVPDEKYRSPGIYTELEYYTLLFEEKYDVAGAAAFYPRTGETLVKQSGERGAVLDAIEEMQEASDEYSGGETFETDPGPLCGWSPDDDDRSAYYGVCSQCTWNVPVDNRDRFEELIQNGRSDREIASELGCEPGESSYWRYKLTIE